jgi:hypothetical protein
MVQVLCVGRDFDGLEREILQGTLRRIQQAARNQTTDLPPSLHSDAHAVQSALQLRWSLQSNMNGEEANDGGFALLWDEFTSPEKLLEEILRNATFWNSDLESQRPWTALLGSLLKLVPSTSDSYTDMALNALLHLVPGDERLALDIIIQLLRLTISTPQLATSHLPASTHYTINLAIDNLSLIWEEPAADVVQVLMPVYRYALSPSEGHYYPPFRPTSQSIALTSSLVTPRSGQPSSLSSISTNLTTEGPRPTPDNSLPVIPMLTRRCDWCSAPLDILLRSGSAEGRFFRSLPPGWDASEVDVVRATLLFSLALQSHPSQDQGAPARMSRDEIVFMCMKVFMLEHGQSDSPRNGEVIGGEVFRDDIVERLMLALLEPFRLRSSRRTIRVDTSKGTLEDVSIPFLGPLQQPFFQFYTDYLGLYDSISFAHPTFGLLLLPATSLKYPRDFRRAFWGEYGHVVRSLSVDGEEVLTGNVMEWLYFPSPPSADGVGEPWDRQKREDGEMVGFYLKALTRHGAKGFAKLVAVHHVSSAIWPDLRLGGGEREEAMARNVLKAVVGGVNDMGEEVLTSILGYSQPEMDALRPPTCYRAATDDLRRRRIEWAVGVCGEDVRSRLPFA